MPTTSSSDRSYHHGDLRTAAIICGLEMLQNRSGEGVGLREVARAVGVSAPALYRHFPDKAALLEALASEGMARLGAAQRDAAEAAGTDPTARFNATGGAYVRFALANPSLFRLIFSHTPRPDAIVSKPESEPMKLLRESAAQLAADGAGDAEMLAVRAWAMAHGVAVLMLDGMLPDDAVLIDRALSVGDRLTKLTPGS